MAFYKNPDGSFGFKNSSTGQYMEAPTQQQFEDCCCGENCPTDCSGCGESQVVLSGFDSCSCLNRTINLFRSGCIWDGYDYDYPGFGWEIYVFVYCDEGKWILDVHLYTHTSYQCGIPYSGQYDFRGEIPAKPCPAGTYSLTFIGSGPDPCTGTHQGVV